MQTCIGSNVRSASYFVVCARVPCWHCGSLVNVAALALPPSHEIVDSETEDDAWRQAGLHAVLFFVSWLPDTVHRRVRQHTRTYRLTRNEATPNAYWANHCEHCSALLEDQRLHCEPGVFMPESAADAASMLLLHIDEAFEATADGYAPDPQLYKWPSTS